MISRRHMELFTENDRLMVRASSDAGLVVDGDYLSRGAVAMIRSGTVISLLQDYPKTAALKFDISIHHGVAEDVTISRLKSGGVTR